MSALLAAMGAVLAVATLRELIGDRSGGRPSAMRRSITNAVRALPLGRRGGVLLDATAERIERAGLGERLTPAVVIAARSSAAIAALPLASVLAPLAPGRLAPAAVLILCSGSAFAPDLILERIARARGRRVAAAMPDALDLISVGASVGRGAPALLQEAARASTGPLREELAQTIAEIECGRSQEQALRELRRRAVTGELAALAGTLERSRRHGSPLARVLRTQASSMRAQQRRMVAERGARAAPKIQLVVALLLVPSVLLIVAAAILANSSALLIGL